MILSTCLACGIDFQLPSDNIECAATHHNWVIEKNYVRYCPNCFFRKTLLGKKLAKSMLKLNLELAADFAAQQKAQQSL